MGNDFAVLYCAQLKVNKFMFFNRYLIYVVFLAFWMP